MTIVFSDKFNEHVITPDHPESPRRLEAIYDSLTKAGLWKNVLTPKDATMKELEAVHTLDYLSFLDKFGERALSIDTLVHKETFSIARLAAGGGIMAAEAAWKKEKPAIALVRPPGHHAGPQFGGGFCYLNNIAIAAKQVLHTAKKVAIVDIDVHHGNGTQQIFHHDPQVLYISTHQRYIYPGTGDPDDFGIGEGKGFTVNVPMMSGAGDSSFDFAYDKIVLPILSEYRPEMLLVSIGTDAHYRDPLASLTLSSNGFAREVSSLLDFAKRNCNNRIAFFLEGGYDLESLSEIITHTVGLFNGKNTPLKNVAIADAGCQELESLKSIVQMQKIYWKL
ncbi:MAG: histone deacetylase [Thermoplasmata archaeon]|nr:histone deacetylase [Thermoplasmata archaeon]